MLTSSFGCRKKRFKAEIQVRYHDQDTAVRRSEQLINVNNVHVDADLPTLTVLPWVSEWEINEECSCLGLDGTLSNILAMKLAYPEEMTPCYKFRPSDDLLESSKKAASSYNREHK